MRVHPTEDQDARQALQLQVGLGSPLGIFDLLPQLRKVKSQEVVRLLSSRQAQLRRDRDVLLLAESIS